MREFTAVLAFYDWTRKGEAQKQSIEKETALKLTTAWSVIYQGNTKRFYDYIHKLDTSL